MKDISPPPGTRAAVIMNLRSMKKIPCFWYVSQLEQMRIALKVITRYELDHSHYFVSNSYGEHFAFFIHRSDPKIESPMYKQMCKEMNCKYIAAGIFHFSINLFNHTGQRSVFVTKFVGKIQDPIPEKILDEMLKACDLYSCGQIYCSDCGKETKKSNLAGSYFAGQYCKECWIGVTGKQKDQGGWKKIEEKETYN